MFKRSQCTGWQTFPAAVLSLCLLLAFAASPASAKAKAEGSYSHSISAEGLELIDAESVNGSIEVTGYDGDLVNIDATIKIEGANEKTCQELLEKIEIKVKPSGNKLKIEYDANKKWGYEISVSYKIQAPSRMGVDAETVNGGISLSGMNGKADLETVNGSISYKGSSGKIDAETVNGSIEFIDATGEIGGEAVNGNLSVVCKDSAPANMDLETINGRIEIELGSTPDAMIDASAKNCKINLKGLPQVSLDKKARSFSSVLGNGSGSYELSTVNGSITINMPAAE